MSGAANPVGPNANADIQTIAIAARKIEQATRNLRSVRDDLKVFTAVLEGAIADAKTALQAAGLCALHHFALTSQSVSPEWKQLGLDILRLFEKKGGTLRVYEVHEHFPKLTKLSLVKHLNDLQSLALLISNGHAYEITDCGLEVVISYEGENISSHPGRN